MRPTATAPPAAGEHGADRARTCARSTAQPAQRLRDQADVQRPLAARRPQRQRRRASARPTAPRPATAAPAIGRRTARAGARRRAGRAATRTPSSTASAAAEQASWARRKSRARSSSAALKYDRGATGAGSIDAVARAQEQPRRPPRRTRRGDDARRAGAEPSTVALARTVRQHAHRHRLRHPRQPPRLRGRARATSSAPASTQLWCLGDLVGYGADPDACVALAARPRRGLPGRQPRPRRDRRARRSTSSRAAPRSPPAGRRRSSSPSTLRVPARPRARRRGGRRRPLPRQPARPGLGVRPQRAARRAVPRRRRAARLRSIGHSHVALSFVRPGGRGRHRRARARRGEVADLASGEWLSTPAASASRATATRARRGCCSTPRRPTRRVAPRRVRRRGRGRRDPRRAAAGLARRAPRVRSVSMRRRVASCSSRPSPLGARRERRSWRVLRRTSGGLPTAERGRPQGADLDEVQQAVDRRRLRRHRRPAAPACAGDRQPARVDRRRRCVDRTCSAGRREAPERVPATRRATRARRRRDTRRRPTASRRDRDDPDRHETRRPTPPTTTPTDHRRTTTPTTPPATTPPRRPTRRDTDGGAGRHRRRTAAGSGGTGRRRRRAVPVMAGRCIAGRYELGERLGVGGMSTVQLAFDRRLERHVAVKLLAEHLADDAQFVVALPPRGARRRAARAPEHRAGLRLRPRRGAAAATTSSWSTSAASRAPSSCASAGTLAVARGARRSSRRRAAGSTTRTATASCTATSSRATCCAPRTASSSSPTSASPRRPSESRHHPGRLGPRHRRLPGARAGPRRGGRPARRPLRARRRHLPAAGRAPALRGAVADRARAQAAARAARRGSTSSTRASRRSWPGAVERALALDAARPLRATPRRCARALVDGARGVGAGPHDATRAVRARTTPRRRRGPGRRRRAGDADRARPASRRASRAASAPPRRRARPRTPASATGRAAPGAPPRAARAPRRRPRRCAGVAARSTRCSCAVGAGAARGRRATLDTTAGRPLQQRRLRRRCTRSDRRDSQQLVARRHALRAGQRPRRA